MTPTITTAPPTDHHDLLQRLDRTEAARATALVLAHDGNAADPVAFAAAWTDGDPLELNIRRLDAWHIDHAALSGDALNDVVGRMIATANEVTRARTDTEEPSPLRVAASAVDLKLIAAIEAAGFRPTDRGPYRPLGPGAVDYLHGYTGPDHYLVDYEPAR
jgi:hypothetical protein